MECSAQQQLYSELSLPPFTIFKSHTLTTEKV